MAVPTDQTITPRKSCALHGAVQQVQPPDWVALLAVAAISLPILTGCGGSSAPVTSRSVDEEVIVVASDGNTAEQAAAPSNNPSAEPANAQSSTNTAGNSAAPSAASSTDSQREPRPEDTVIGPRRRLPDDRPDINEQRLQTAGIRIERGERLVLLTDLPPAETVGLCELADQLFETLEQELGPLPPAPDGSQFQVTGHLIGDTDRFRSIGLMPAAELTFRHGRHVNYQFWMNNPDTAYYRRHLLLHEFTHCFMTCESGMTDIPPLWYIEGMAEYFATHRINTDSSVSFGVMPDSFQDFEGWGRISELRRVARLDAEALASDQQPAIIKLSQVMREVVSSQQDVDYAWWWGVCWMLQNHPQYAADFAKLRTHQHRTPFLSASRQFLQQHESSLPTSWLLFVESLETGFRPEREFSAAATEQWTLSGGQSRRVTVRPDQGWISTGLQVAAGEQVRITANGRYAMNQPATDWQCEPQGVSVEYVRGQPLGILLATVVANDGSRIQARFPAGTDGLLTADFAGTIWLQINDHSDDRHNNSGMLSVSLKSTQ